MSSDEIVTIVDENNNVTGSAPRSQMRAEGMCHRATYILVFDPAGRMFVQKRTLTKDIYPGYYDIATGGVVLAGESYDVSAERELAEELGVENTPLKAHFEFYHEEGRNRVWGRVYSCVWDGPIVLQAEEVASGDYYPVPEIVAMSGRKPFTPDGLYVLKRFLQSKAEYSGGGR